MLTEALDVASFEAATLHRADHRAHLVQLAVGEDVALDEGAAGEAGASTAQPAERRRGGLRARDGVVEQPSAVGQQLPQSREVLGEAGEPHVLEHADRRDGVVRPVRHVTVVLQPDLDEVAAARPVRPFAGQLGLLGRDRDADGAHAVLPRGVDHHAAPPAAHVEQAHSRAQPELGADELVLRALGLVEGRVRRWEVGAGIGHRLAEDEAVEVVRDVVVVRDRRRVSRTGVPRTGEVRLLGRRRRRQPQRAEPARRSEQARPVGRRDPHGGLGEVVAQRERGVHVAVHVELAAHIRPSETELAGGPEQVAQGERRSQVERHGRSRVAEAAPVPEPDARRWVGTEEALDRRCEEQGCGRPAARHLITPDVGQWRRVLRQMVLSDAAGDARPPSAGPQLDGTLPRVLAAP
jgi:hypothetical protein